jgi:branched-chain amino acid transport system permease protein
MVEVVVDECMMNSGIQMMANGLIAGLTVGLLGLAFSLVYTPTRVFHVALGGIFAAVPYVAWACLQAGWGWLIALVASLMVGCALSVTCELVNHSRLERRGTPPAAHLVSSLGLYIALVQIIALVWGNEVKTLRIGADSVLHFAGATLTRSQVLGGLIALFCLGGFYLWLHFSQWGLRLRALGENPTECALRGFNVRALRLLAFGLSGALCAGSSLLVAYDVGFDPHGGLMILLLAIVAVIIGGKDSFFGCLVGGVLVGILRSGTVWFLSARWQEAITFLVLAVFLMLCPRGILAKASRLEATT